MKKILIPSLIVCSLFANEQNFIEIGGGFLKSKDNFSTESKKNISSLNSAENENLGLVHLSLFYKYDINKNFDIYSSIGEGGIKLGSTINTNSGRFGLGAKFGVSEEWENPFLTQSDRKETDVYEVGLYTSYSFSINENYQTSLAYEFSTVTYDKETLIDDLKREGNRHIVSLENVFNTRLHDRDLNYMVNFLYEMYDADGKASSYDRYELELGIESNLKENISIFLLSNFAKKEYDSFNTQVNKKVDVDIYGINAGLTWEKPFNYENVYVNVKTGYEKEEANVNFYDKENTYGMLSVGYRF
jgi:hypothetical protein